MGFRFYSYFHCTTGPRVLRLRDAHLCFPWGWDAGGFLSQGFRPTLSAEQALSARARSGLLPTLTPSPVVLCCCALLGAGSPCACGGRGQVLALLAQLGRVRPPEPQEWGSPGPVRKVRPPEPQEWGSPQGPLSSISPSP